MLDLTYEELRAVVRCIAFYTSHDVDGRGDGERDLIVSVLRQAIKQRDILSPSPQPKGEQ